MKKFKKSGILFIFLLAMILAVSDADTMQAAAYGYTDHGHTWVGHSTCSGCSGTGYSTKAAYAGLNGYTKCTSCLGGGFTQKSSTTSTAITRYGCTTCGGSGQGIYSTIDGTFTNTGNFVKGSGYYGTCGHCNGKGTNYYCSNSGCKYSSYDYWTTESGYNSVCYTTANTYTQTINHYLWNADTSAWNYWTTTYGTGTYGTTYYPSYTTTPTGYYRYSLDWAGGWTVSGAGTFSAYYYPNTYSVTYNANGGSGAPAAHNFLYNSTAYISSTVPTRTGYTFNNWYVVENGATFSPGQAIPKGWGSCTLVAQWKANSYTVTLVPNGGTCSRESFTTTYDTANYWNISGWIPVRAGYKFLGWYTAIEGGTQVYGADGCCTNEGTYFSNNIWNYTDNVTLYAQWERVPYTVTYDANGGTVETDSLITYYDEPVDLSLKAEKDGLVFVGWNTDPDAKNGLQSLNMPESDLTLYAIYSIPVSDVKEVYLKAWLNDDTSTSKTYLLARTDEFHMLYTYELEATDVVADLNSTDVSYAVIAWDNAGNYRILKEGGINPDEVVIPDDIIEKSFIQTVEHYLYDPILETYVLFDTVSEEKLEGEIYTPAYLTEIPSGYQKSTIDAAYTVIGDKTSRAEYVPIEYTLSFDAQGGSVSPLWKSIRYNDVYGEMPTPTRKGYTFLGWYTAKTGGTLVVSSDKYLIAGDSTVYAHWELNKYKVTYDYWTNGGTYSSASSIDTPYGTKVDLSVTAVKSGYTFVGWNTNPDAKTALSSLVMEDKELVLYAIYKKDITATFIDSDNGTKRTVTTTVYNNQTDGEITIPSQNSISGWISLGWSLSEDADASIDATPGTVYMLSNNLTFYGCYVKDITLSYDANGSSQDFGSWTQERYFNSYGNYKNPVFTIAAAPTLTDHSFIAWVDSVGGYSYNPGENVEIIEDTLLTAQWDRIPEIEAYDRYFTLEEAENGEITPDKLLEKVIGTDKEDGTLINGEDVIVLDYNASDFLNSTEVEITYQATDSFGNVVEKTITVHIVDTTVKKSPKVRYVRFISSRFFTDENGNLLAPELGGLETTSIWRSNDSYKSLLESALYNTKVNEEYKNIEYFGTSTEVKIAGSGEWQTEKSTWVFTKEDIEDVKEFVDTHGYGNIKEPNALELFIEAFRKCLKLN